MAADSSPVLPQVEKPVPKGPAIHPFLFVASWIFFSNLTILFNKWLIDTAGFKYPAILTCWHLVFATIATQILSRTTHLLDGRKNVKMTGRLYLRAIVPIGVCYSISLVCSNLVYLYLSVSFIQMLKASAPVAMLVVSWCWGVANPSMRVLLNVLAIVFGVALASFGEIDFSWTGFAFQTAGIIFESIRLVMIQVLLSDDGQKMDPIVSLYYYAPVCAAMNLVIVLCSEWWVFDFADLQRTGVGMLFANASVAFMLNVTSVFLIGRTSGLVMTLTGIFKNILLVVASVLIWNSPITFLQFVGYSVALAGLIYYSIGWEQISGVAKGIATYAKTVYESPNLAEGSGLTPMVRRALVMGVAILALVMLAGGYFYRGGVLNAQVPNA